ncbi:MAG: hypothetical protein R3B48_09155 [Kofleriaceae bacterium]
MDGSSRLSARARAPVARAAALGVACLAAALSACGGASPRVLARGVLPYALAVWGDAVVTVELSERFELVVREGRTERRLALGPPEIDLRALAVHGATAYVGSDDGTVREIDLASLETRRSFPLGAPVLAVAADARVLLTADASGALCLRRRADGALLQCARPELRVDELALAGGIAYLASPRAAPAAPARAWTVPALARATAPPPPSPSWRGGVVRAEGRTVVWSRGGQRRVVLALDRELRHLAVTPAGALFVTAWPRDLRDAVLVTLAP